MNRPKPRLHMLLLLVLAFALGAAACGSDESDSTTTAGATDAPATTTTAGAADSDSNTTTTTTQDDPVGTPADVPGFETWEEVLAAADGTTVNWFMWGGNDNLNGWVDEYIGDVIEERYNVTLNRVPVTDTGDLVNQVLAEAQAGVTEGGSVDLIWINGDNFKTLKEAELLFGPWSEGIPNAVHVNWDDPSIANDFGVAVDGRESPWGSAQMVFAYDSAFVPEPPTTLGGSRRLDP